MYDSNGLVCNAYAKCISHEILDMITRSIIPPYRQRATKVLIRLRRLIGAGAVRMYIKGHFS